MFNMDNNDQECLAECSDDEKYEVGPKVNIKSLHGILLHICCHGGFIPRFVFVE